MKVTRKLPWDWWLHPSFDFGIHYPMPYIWFGYWLITWGDMNWDDECWIVGKIRIPKVSIDFLPD